jgi:hypothetical protein
MPQNSVSTQPVSATPIALVPQRKKNPDFQQRLKQYSAAALGVAGVSALASAQSPAQRHIVYTPADIALDTKLSRTSFIPIDFNNDGSADIYLILNHFTDFFSGGLGFDAYGRINVSAGQNFTIGSHAIPKGEIIDKAGTFKSGTQFLVTATSGSYEGAKHTFAAGPFKNITNKYLGVRFLINGKIHEGWVRMTLTCTGADIKGTISGYAYDTVPNELGLAAGQVGGRVGAASAESKVELENAPVGSLGMLAAGVEAIPYWRK